MYEIELASSEGDFFAVCQLEQVEVTQCVLQMSDLTSAPYNLAFDALVYGRARAHNFYGVSQWSPLQTEQGARIRQLPA